MSEDILDPTAPPPLPPGLGSPSPSSDTPAARRPPVLPIPRLPGTAQPAAATTPSTPTTPPAPPASAPAAAGSSAPQPRPADPAAPTPATPPASPAVAAPGAAAAAAPEDTATPTEGDDPAAAGDDNTDPDRAGDVDPASAKPPISPADALNIATSTLSPALQAAMGLPATLAGLGSGLLAPFAQILSQFGQGTPVMPAASGLPPRITSSLSSGDPLTAVTGDPGQAFADDRATLSTQAQAMDHLDKNLRKTLQDSAANATLGRDKIQQIIEQVRAALTALGPVMNTPAGQAGVIKIISEGLTSAGAVLSGAVGTDALNSTSVQNMARDYIKDLNGGAAEPVSVLASNVSPVSRLTPNSSPRDVAAAIIQEARRRGYNPQQTVAILSTAMQESALNPRAMHPNGLWHGIFQQDTSYPGRSNPNTNISEFFNRLATKGGPSSPNIWKSIFWLQQAPGIASADQAFAGGRQHYMTEIQSKVGAATNMYQQITRSHAAAVV